MVLPVLKPNALQFSFFSNNPFPCLLLQQYSCTVVTANAAAAVFFNTTPALLEAVSFQDLLQTGANPDVYELLKKSEHNEPLELLFKTGNSAATAQVFVNSIAAGEPLLGLMLVPDATPNKVRENEALLSAMVNETSDVLTAADLDFKPITWSKAAEQLYGITGQQVIGKDVRAYLDIRYANTTVEAVRHTARFAGAWRGEMSFVRPADAKKMTLLVTFKLIKDNAGQPVHYIISGTDITEQKETEFRLRATEEKLQQSEAFYRTLISDSVSGNLLTAPDGTINFASPAIHNLLGYTADELVGRNAFEFVHAEDQAIALTAFQNEVAEAPEVKSIEVRVLKKDATWLWCSVRGHNLLDNPHIGSVVISLQDDTRRKQAIDSLKESEQRFRTLIKDITLGVTLHDADGTLLMYNKATADLFGVKEAALEGANLYGLFKKVVHENEMPFVRANWPMLRAARTKKKVQNVVMGFYVNGATKRTWLLVNTNPVLDEAGNIRHIISSFTDVTGHKKLVQRLLEERLNQQRLLTQATIDGQERERKEIGKELHDNIGQQLATTKLYLDLASAASASEATAILERATRSITNIINEVRTLSHSLVPPTLGDLGLVESVQELLQTICLVQPLQIKFEHTGFCEENLPENGKLMLYRIVQEALNNCIKHAQATTVQLTLKRNGGTVFLQVQDNGRGFSPESIRKGLGIRNIRNRAEIFGGSLTVHSVPGGGCTIQVSIPEAFHFQETAGMGF